MSTNTRPFRFGRSVLVALAAASFAEAQTPLRLTTGSGPGARYPVLALDADVVAYVAMGAGGRELFLSATDGSARVQLTNGAHVRVGHGTFDAWAPISISDDGNVLAYWNDQGVVVIDRVRNTEVMLATSSLLPMPRLDGGGSRLVFQAPVSDQLEVFLADTLLNDGHVQLTQNSGPGRRLPYLRAGKVLFQKLVASDMELFVHDLATGTTTGITSGSGGGNRHGRLTPDGTAVVYEAVVAGVLTPMHLDLSTSVLTPIAAGTSGAGLPQGDGDAQIVLQTTVNAPEVVLADPALVSWTGGSRGGHRLPALDRHGQVIVWQAEHQGSMEVFAVRRCWPVVVTNYGTHGQPSVGAFATFSTTWRCSHSLGLHTQLPASMPAIVALGAPQNLSLAGFGAPGNWLSVTLDSWQLLGVGAQGRVTFVFPLSAVLLQTHAYCQFALFDTAANALGIVTSKGFDVTFR